MISLNKTKIIIRGYCQKSEVNKGETAIQSFTTAHDEQQYEQNVKDIILEKALEFVL